MRKESEKLDYRKLLKNKEVKAFLKKGNENLGVLGYTEHSEKHCAIVAKRAGMILKKLGYSEHEVELAQIAGAMHDIGNAINRNFLGRMLMCRRASELLGMKFKLTANGSKVL